VFSIYAAQLQTEDRLRAGVLGGVCVQRADDVGFELHGGGVIDAVRHGSVAMGVGLVMMGAIAWAWALVCLRRTSE